MVKLLLILLVFLPERVRAENQLSPVINDLSIVARLINGISVQSEFMRSSQNLNAVVGELLGIGDSIPELLKVKVKDLMQDVDGIMKDVKGLPAGSNQNLEGVGDLVKFLSSVDVEKVKGVVQMDLSRLESQWKLASDVEIDNLKPDVLVNFVENLKFILETPMNNDFSAQADFLTKLREVESKTSKIGSAFRKITANSFNLLWEVLNTKSHFGDITAISKVANEYDDKSRSIPSLSQALTDMKDAIDKLKPIIRKSQASSATNQALGAMTLFSTDKVTDKKLTAGLPNGISDLKMLFDDLNGKWLKENVADGKDMKMMVTALEPLKKFYENLKPLETSWGKLREDPETGKVVRNIATILMNGKILNPDELISKLDPAAKCVAGLVSTKLNRMFEKFDSFYNGLDKVDEELKKLQNLLDTVKKSQTITTVENLKDGSFPVKQGDLNSKEIVQEVDNVIQNQEIKDIYKLLSEYLEKLNTIDVGFIKSVLSLWSTGFAIKKGLSDSGLVDAVECLNKEKFDYTGAEAFSRFKKSVESVKSQTDVQGKMKMFGSAIDSLISSDKKVKETVDGMKVSRRRRRSAQGPLVKGLLKLADSGKVAQELGNGVEVLREMSEVFENQGKVLKVAKSVDSVNTVIQGIPEMDGKWTADNKKALEKLVDEVNKLNKAVNKDRSLKGVWKLFGAAQSVNGAPIESRILGTLVYEQLERSSDPNVKPAAPDFKDFPPLQLDFTGSKRMYLRDASMILPTITGFFKDFFAIVTSTSTQRSEPSPNYLLFAGAGAGGLLLIAAVGIGGYFGFRARSNKKKLKNRDRMLIYIAFLSNDQEMFVNNVIQDRQAPRAKEMVKAGAYVGRFVLVRQAYETALHSAVFVNDPDLVEFLIKNGADPTVISSRNETPEDLVARLMEEERNGGKNHLKIVEQIKIKAIFKKYQKKTFQQKLPPLLAICNFSVMFPIKKCKEFEETHSGKLVANENFDLDKTTHCVVEVDKNGVMHFDKKSFLPYFQSVFGRSVLVPMEWAKMCAKDTANFHKDYDMRVTKVEINGNYYTNLDKIKEFARGKHIPCGAGINVLLLAEDEYAEIVGNLGFQLLDSPADLAKNKSKSFYLPDTQNLIVYEGEMDEYAKQLKGVKLNDHTVMSLEEFVVFIFEMKIDLKGGEKKKKTTNSTSSTVKTI